MNKVIEKNSDVVEKTESTYDEAYKAALEYFQNDLPATVWLGKYAVQKNNIFSETTPDDMHLRLATEFAKIEEMYGDSSKLNGKLKTLSEYGQKREPLTKERIFDYFKDFKYIIPQGSVMSILGNNTVIGSLSNCIVLPKVYDSYGGICYADQQLTQLMKRRCGVGVDISTLRPEGSGVSNAAGSSTGAISFMERFSNTTREVAQNGRRGALMISIHCNHPDVEKFATIKQNSKNVTGANVSIKLTDDFMKAVVEDKEYTLRYPCTDSDVKFLNWNKPLITKTVKAKELWNVIVQCAWNSAEPGLIFWDHQHNYSTSSIYPEFENISTNPCSEIAMGNDSCRLIANNMFNCVENPFRKNSKFNYDKWYEINYEAQRLMDDLVELELKAIEQILAKLKKDKEPNHIKQIEITTWEQLYDSGKKGRRTGLGITALGDTLAALGLKYDSKEAISIVDKMMKTKCEAEWDSTIDMAIERGAFESWDAEIDETSTFIQMLKKDLPEIYERNKKYGRRNISPSTVAPTGSLSMLATVTDKGLKLKLHNTTSGMEPMFNLKPNECWNVRRKKVNANDKNSVVDYVDDLGDKWQEFKVFHSGFKMWALINKPNLDLNTLSKDDLKKLVSESPYGGAGSSEIDWIKRVEVQSVIQKYTTHSISSTINLPNDVKPEKVGEIYIESWKQNLKGITVYRDGCRSGVLVSDTKKEDKLKISKTNAPKRPKVLNCDIHHVTAEGKKWVVLVGLLDGDPFEVFAFKEKKLKFPSSYKEGTITKVKRGQYDLACDKGDFLLEDVKDFFETDEQENLTRLISLSLRHGADVKYIYDQLNKSEGTIVSFSKAIGRTLKKYLKDEPKGDFKCENCGSTNMILQEGCRTCVDCGNGKCG